MTKAYRWRVAAVVAIGLFMAILDTTIVSVGPQLMGANTDLAPVTMRFVDAHHTGYPDMIIQVQTTSITFHNTHETFTIEPDPPG
jgi:hypothetical protein